MTTPEAIFYLEAMLDDTLDHNDDTDAERIAAVEFAIRVLRKEETPTDRTR